MSEAHPNPQIRWNNRRKMAYISIACLICMLLWVIGLSTYAVIAGKTLLELGHVATILSTLVVGFVSIIGAYVGFATWGDKIQTSQYGSQYPGDPYAKTDKSAREDIYS